MVKKNSFFELIISPSRSPCGHISHLTFFGQAKVYTRSCRHSHSWLIGFVSLFVCDASLSSLGCGTFYWQAQNNNGRWPKLIHLQHSHRKSSRSLTPNLNLRGTWEEPERIFWMSEHVCNSWLHGASVTCLRVEYMLRIGRIDCFDCSVGLNLPASCFLFLFFCLHFLLMLTCISSGWLLCLWSYSTG